MNVTVRVAAAAARAQIAGLEKQVAALEAQLMQANAAQSKLGAGAAMTGLVANASRMQWVGRQIQTNFTYPLLIAAGFATKFALDNEKAMVRVRKVYGDGSQSAREMNNEITALSGAFEALSNEFGVNQAAVIGIAGDWAAAGASGIALARATKLTLQTMILGEMEAAKATEALIAIQAQYQMSTKDLSKTIDTLNMVENQTGASMQGLVQGLQRAAGTARSAGIDVRHLAAMIASINPAAGTAAQAGNGLKTIISRLLSPTREASEVLDLMNIKITDTAWKSLNGAQRLELLAQRYKDLGKGVRSSTQAVDRDGKATGKYLSAQQAVVSSVIASRYQINRFDVLMREITSTNGYYRKALDSTASAQDNFNQKQYELRQVLESNPQKLKQIWVIMQNAMADVITPLIPAMVWLASQVAKLFNAFANLPGPVQKFIAILAVLLMLVGPVTRYFYAWVVLFDLLGGSFRFMAGVFAGSGRILTAPFTMLGTAISGTVGLVSKFWAWMIGTSRKAQAIMVGQTAAASSAQAAAMSGGGLVAALKNLWSTIVSITTVGNAASVATTAASSSTMLAITAGNQSAMLALTAGGGAARVAEEVRESGRRVFIANRDGTVRVGAEAAEQAARLIEVTAGGEARVVAEQGFNTMRMFIVSSTREAVVGFESYEQLARLTMARTGGAARVSAEAQAAAMRIMIASATGETIAGSEALANLLRLSTLEGSLSAMAALEAGASATRLAITDGGAASRLAIEASSGAATTALVLRQQGSVVAAQTVGGQARVAAASRAAAQLVAVEAGAAATMAAIPVAAIAAWAFAIAAILGIAYAFRDQIGDAFQAVKDMLHGNSEGIKQIFFNVRDTILNAFWSLPAGVQSAIIAVVNVIRNAALAIYEWFSYINPWARHSPSLVESVTSGFDEISRQFARAKGIGNIFATTAKDLAAFKRVASKLGKGPFSDERQDVAQAYKGLLPLFDKLVKDWKVLTDLAEKQKAAMDKQQAVVDKWSKNLDEANKKLNVQQDRLDDLQQALSKLNAEYQEHQDALNNFANAPLVGMKAMEDQIFANDMAQKQLRLEMLRWEDVNGSIDDVRDNYNKLQGDIEMLRGEQASLRAAGAGSDILGPMQQQIDAMQASADTMADTLSNGPMAEWQKQLEDLQRQGEMLDLENSLQFDPLKKQIDDLVNATRELTFEEVVAGIQNEQAAMAQLQPQIDALTEATKNQQAVVDALTDSRDAIQAVYDRENEKLQALQDEYNKTKDVINEVEDALRSMASEAQRANGALGGAGSQSPGAANFAGAAGGGFPDVGGAANIGREGAGLDQSALIDQFTKDSAAQLGQVFGSFDIFGPLKKKWNEGWAWLKASVGNVAGPVVDAIGNAFGGASIGGGFAKSFSDAFDLLYDIGKSVTEAIKSILELFAPDIERIFNALVDAGKRIWTKIGPELAKFGPVLKNLVPAFRTLWNILKPIVAIVGIVLVASLKKAASIISHVLGPALNFIIDGIALFIKMIRGMAQVVIGVLSGDWKMAWQGIKDIVSVTFEQIWNVISGAGEIILGYVSSIVTGIAEFFKWLWNILVGNSIVPDTVNAIIACFQLLAGIVEWLWKNVIQPIYKVFVSLWNTYLKPFLSGFFNLIKGVWNTLTGLGGWVWNNVVKPVWDKFKSGMGHVKDVMGDAKTFVVNAFQGMKNKAQDVVDWIKGIPQKIKNLAGDFKDAGLSVINNIVKGIKSAGNVVGSIAGTIWDWIKKKIDSLVLDPLRNALKFTISIGPYDKTFDFSGAIPHLYTGGIVRGSRRGQLAVLGDKGYDEAVIPLNGPWSPKDRSLPGGMGANGGSGERHFHFYGDLSFPNIKDGSDAETFITNLEILSKD